MQLNGTIKTFPLSELLALVVSSSVTGVLYVGRVPKMGVIRCRDGRIYHAQIGSHTGLAAIYAMIELRDAPFVFQDGDDAGAETIGQEPWSVVAQALWYERLMARIRPYIASLGWVPALRAEAVGTVRVRVEHWPVLASIDGQRSIREIAALLGQEVGEVALALCEFAERRIAVVRPPLRIEPIAARPRSPIARAWAA